MPPAASREMLHHPPSRIPSITIAMNTYSTLRYSTLRYFAPSLLALTALTLAAPAFAQRDRRPGPDYPLWEDQAGPDRGRGVQRFGGRAEFFGLQRMAGRPVRARNGDELSTITDFLVDPQTGRVFFALLPSGGGARGMTYRIVPISAFTASDETSLRLRLDRGQWDRVGTLEEPMLKNHIVIDVDHQQRLSRQLGMPVNEINDGRGPLDLVRASSLRGQVIRAGSGGGQVGRIDDIVIDVTRHESAVIIATDRTFAGSEQRFVIRYQNLGKRDGRTWTSTLRRDDFPSNSDRVSLDYRAEWDRPYRPDWDRDGRPDRPDYNRPGLPTGREPAYDLAPAATAVKQGLDRSWAGGRVEVVPENNRLVLRGIVEYENERLEAERLATRIAPDVRIENQIAIRRR